MMSFFLKILFLFFVVSSKLSADLIQQTIVINTGEKIRVLLMESVQYDHTEVSIKLKSKKDPIQVFAKGETIKIEEDENAQTLVCNLGERTSFGLQNVEEVTITIPRILSEHLVHLNLKGSTTVEVFDLYSTLRYRVEFYGKSRLVLFDYNQWNLLSSKASKNAKKHIQLYPSAFYNLPKKISDQELHAIRWSATWEEFKRRGIKAYPEPIEYLLFAFF